MDHIKKAPARQQIAGELNELAMALGKLNAAIAECEARIRDASNAHNSTDLRVDAALEFARSGAFSAVGNDLAELQERHIHLRLQRDAVAVALQNRQSDLSAIEIELSVAASQAVSTRHRAIAKDFMVALTALDAAMQAEIDLVEELASFGYTARFPKTLAWSQVGRIADNSGSAAYYKAREIAPYAKQGA